MTWEKVNEDDKGRWNEFKNTETGESSIKEHKLKVVWKSCKENDHFWEVTGNREVTCTKCGIGRTFILGLDKIVDGRLVRATPLPIETALG